MRLLAPLLFAAAAASAAPRTYLYYPSSDVASTQETLFPQAGTTNTTELASLCDSTPTCIGFNSNGWLKNGSTSLAPQPVDLYLAAPTPAPAPPLPLWPYPRSLSSGATTLPVSAALQLLPSAPCADLEAALARFAATSLSRAAAPPAPSPPPNLLTALHVTLAPGGCAVPLDLGVNESYSLTIPEDGSPALLSAPTVWGALLGLQTLAQLLAFDAETGAYAIPATPLAIADAPRFAWRGVMVDPARAFLPLATLRALVDSLPLAKLNTLHLHLLDSESFPLQVGAPFEGLWASAFSPRERYTRADLAGLIEYARARGVRVVLEFDSPGHCGGICTSYPNLCPAGPGCSGTVLDPSSPATLPAMQAIIDTLASLSIDSVLHGGGDEVGQDCWLNSAAVQAWAAAHNVTNGEGVYKYFVNASSAMMLARGKAPMRWEEVWAHFGASLHPATIIHAWLSSAALVNATNHGYRAVFSVDSQAYYMDYLDVQWDSVYSVDILAGVTNASAVPLVLGGQLCLWGETVDAASLLSVLWPRAAAAGEALWGPPPGASARSYDVVARLAEFRCLLLERGLPAPLPGALSAGDLRPPWTVGSCSGGYSKLR